MGLKAKCSRCLHLGTGYSVRGVMSRLVAFSLNEFTASGTGRGIGAERQMSTGTGGLARGDRTA